ncbi:SDR family oxidoreductase [Xanthobacter sp. TB0139]|uniref:SDR family oxidoreductase n=1 Tax=Xanthobacter sp. TB0139 TaxID=3459178 RepID=UPI00403979AF
MERKMDAQVAIVTGGARGIGAAIARRLAADGFHLVINYVGSRQKAETLAAELGATGRKAMAVRGDVSRAEHVAGLFDAAEQAFGGVDVLVNNAGILQQAPLRDASDDMFDEHIATNLKGVFNGMREGARRVRAGGRIISMSSSLVGLYLPSYGVYAATKAGVEAMTQVLARELRGRSISVNAVAPGPTATELFLDGKPEEVVAGLARQSPLERLGEPEDIAAAVAFLAGPDGAWVNGQVLRVNGGVI